MASDERKEYLAQMILDLFGSSSASRGPFDKNFDDIRSSLTSNSNMDDFLDSPTCSALEAVLVNRQGMTEIKLNVGISGEFQVAENTIHVVKVGSEPITIHNICKSISVFTMPSSPQDSLYHVLHTVYLPLLTRDKASDDGLVRHCQNLEAALGVSVRRSGAKSFDELHVAGILKLSDETSFWYEASSAASSDDLRERALAFHGIISEIENAMDGCETKSFEDVSDALSTVLSKVDDLWRMEEGELQSLRARSSLRSAFYPQARMARLLELIGDEVIAISRKKLSALDIWRTPFPNAERELLQNIELCQKHWLEKLNDLVTVDWRNSPNVWRDPIDKDTRTSNFIQRLQGILKVLTTQNSLKKLLSSEEQHALSLDKSFLRFAEINALHINPYSNAAWEGAMSEYKSNMQPIEAIMSEKLRDRYDSFLIPKFEEALADQSSRVNDPSQKLKSTIPQPLQLLQSFMKYEELLKMPNIEKLLEPERDKLLNMLSKYVAGLRAEFEQVSAQFESNGNSIGPKQFSGKNFAGIVGTVAYVGQIQSKLDELCVSAKPHISSLTRTGDFEQQALKLAQDLKEAKSKEVMEWTEEMKRRLLDKENPMALQVSGRLMSFDKSNGRLHVHYSENLVTFIREVRQLSALGCTIPKSFEQEVEKAYKHYRSAVVLKQAAAAYNSMDSQIIPCQLPMLIEDGQALEKLLRDQKLSVDGKHITWEDTKHLQKYAETLQDKNTKLASRNARLRIAHGRMIQSCIQLMKTDLVRDRDQWRKGVNEMRKIKDEVVREGFLHTTSWVKHVDIQLYKALDFQYKLGLECCHENLTPMEVKLVFKQKKLSFDPPLEEIKKEYYSQLKRFIIIPSVFRGVGDTDMFKSITDRNLDGLSIVFQQAERLFKKLSDVADKFSSWVALGTVEDLDVFIEERLREVEDWESNFRLLETRLRDAKKLSDTDRVDCITVSNGQVKSTIEEQLNEFGRALGRSLRKSAIADIEVLEEFVRQSLEALSVTPESVEEIANATARWSEIAEQSVIKRELKARMEEKGRLLKIQNSGAILDTYQLTKNWDELELRMSAHEKNVEEQKDKIRALLDTKVKNYNIELEKFISRWKGMKPDGTGMGDRARAVEITKEVHHWAEEFEELKKKGITIKRECTQFGVEEPTFNDLSLWEEDITKTLASWGFFEEFLNEMSSLTEEDWLSIRDRLYVMEDFLSKWAERLKGRDTDPVVRHMRTEIERLKKNVPFLKFVKGDSFTQEHWSTLFKMLGFPKGINRAELKLFHFLDASDNVVKKLAEIQELQARAAAEMTIQDAIDEIQKWGMEANFNVIEQVDSNNRRVVLIKEWKEIQTQVGDFQSILQAVRDSPYFHKFAVQAEEWDRALSVLGNALTELQSIQRKWLYLEPIFGRGALPHEQGRFLKVDEDFRRLLAEVESNPSVRALADISALEERLHFQIEQLNRCQKSLSDFLEEKRSKFPRFYFIGDDDLLEILGQSKNPTIIQAHLKKLFQAIYAVDFSDDKKQILAIKSLEGETVDLINPVSVSDTVELWLAELSKQMVLALEMELVECMKNLDTSRFPSMILCTASQICFCVAVEEAVVTDGLKQLEASQRDKLSQLTSYGQVSQIY
jgi:dynein heavy chain 2, cytosolic